MGRTNGYAATIFKLTNQDDKPISSMSFFGDFISRTEDIPVGTILFTVGYMNPVKRSDTSWKISAKNPGKWTSRVDSHKP